MQGPKHTAECRFSPGHFGHLSGIGAAAAAGFFSGPVGDVPGIGAVAADGLFAMSLIAFDVGGPDEGFFITNKLLASAIIC